MSSYEKSPCKATYSDHHDEDELKKPEDYNPLRTDEVFVRGLIQVQFERSVESGLEDWKFGEENRREELSNAWSPELKEILSRNNLVSWKPVFPLVYPWSTFESTECAREAYIEAGRDKFVTFDFAPGADVVGIARELKTVPELEVAAPIPEIGAPATPMPGMDEPAAAIPEMSATVAPLSEPLVGGNDHPLAVANPPEDPTGQWYLFRCEVPEAWNLEASGQGVVIADIDWGFDRNHEDLMSRIELGRSMFANPDIISHGNMRHHGTGVLGLAGAAVNGRGMAGIAYEATLWAIQAGSNNNLNEDFWVAAIDFVRNTFSRGRKVIIVEAQTKGSSNIEAIPSIRQEIMLAINAGIVVVVPAGNGNETGNASVDDAGNAIPETGSILVGATRFHPNKNERAESNGGDRVVVYAPGDSDYDLTCGSPPAGYRLRFGGTSGAAAKVAGVVALMLEKNDRLTPQRVREILGESTKDVVDQLDRRVGVLLDAHQAVSEAIGPVAPLPVRRSATRSHSLLASLRSFISI
jgi:subtilisin family serine protease